MCLFSAYNALAVSKKLPFSIAGLSTKPVLPTEVANWAALPDAVRFTVENSEAGVFSRLSGQLKQGDDVLCGITAPVNGIPQNAFTVKSYKAADLMPALASCSRLAPGTYTLCVRFYADPDIPLSAEACTEFLVEEAVPVTPSYSPPKNIAPVPNKFFLEQEVKEPLVFQWTPVTPPPGVPVSYKFRIWQLLEGQTAQQAMDAGQPIITKDVEGTQVTLKDELPVPCKIPYTCRFVWNVQALNSAGQPIGNNKGYSDPTAIVVTTYIIQIDDIKVNCTEKPGVYAFSYTITNLNPNTAKLTAFVATASVPAGATVSSFAPPLNSTVVSGASITITGTINASPALSYICLGAEITDVVNSFWKASRDTCIKVGLCKCTACDAVKLTINPTNNITINANNSLTIVQPIAVGTSPLKLVKNVKAELEYFEFLPESEDCLPCNKDPKSFGNIQAGVFAGSIGVGMDTHALQWSFSPPKNLTGSSNANIAITMPPTVKCCAATIRWCIRYIITFQDCTVCSKVVCYEKKKQGCSGSVVTDPNPIPNN